MHAGYTMSTFSDKRLANVTSRMTPETTVTSQTDVVVNSSPYTSLHVSDVTRTSKSLLTSVVTPTTDDMSRVVTSGIRRNLTTSAVNSFTTALTSTLRTATSSVASTSPVELGRDVTTTTDKSTNVPSFSTVVSQTSTTPPVLITTGPHSSAPTTTSRDGPQYSTEYSFSPLNRTSFLDMQTNYSHQAPVTESKVTNNRTSTVSPLDLTTLTTTSTAVTSLTHSLSFSSKPLAIVTSRMTSRTPNFTSQTEMVMNGSTADDTSMTLDVTATTSYIDGTFIHY